MPSFSLPPTSHRPPSLRFFLPISYIRQHERVDFITRVQRSDFSLSVFIETRDTGYLTSWERALLISPYSRSWEVSFPLFSGLDRPFLSRCGLTAPSLGSHVQKAAIGCFRVGSYCSVLNPVSLLGSRMGRKEGPRSPPERQIHQYFGTSVLLL